LLSLLEIAERAYKGPRREEMDWNMSLFKAMRGLTEKHKLAYSGPDLYFGVDDDYVDRAWQAAVEFLAMEGVYCITTNRIIQFDEEEVLEAAKAAPSEIVIGEGRDSRTIKKRMVEDCRRVNVISGGHCPWPQEIAIMAQMAYARVQRGDMIEGFNMLQTDGHSVHGLPLAVYAAKREAEMMREAVRQAGRPGMAITLYPILTSSGPMIAPSDPVQGLRRTDGLLLSILPDTKVEADYIANAIHYERYGGYKVNGGDYSVVGGFCGGVEGALVETIVKALAAWMCYRDQMQYGGYVASQEDVVSSRWRLEMESGKVAEMFSVPEWPTYVIQQALSRHTNIIRFGGFGGKTAMGGIGSEADFLSSAKTTVVNTVLGANLSCTTGGNPTPLHVEFKIEAADATVKAKIAKQEVPEFEKNLEALISERLRESPQTTYGDRRMLAYADFDKYFGQMKDAYDFVNGKPTEEIASNAQKARRALKDLGLDLEAVATL
jgi:methylamine--corrinoid protein Co-methyltransferase